MCPTGKYGMEIRSKHSSSHSLFGNGCICHTELFVQCLYHHRHHQHHLRPEDSHIPHHMHKGIIDTKRCSQGEALEPVHDKTECMMDRKHTQHLRSGFYRNRHGQYVLCQIFLCKQNTFTFACGSGSIDNRCNVLCPDTLLLILCPFSFFQKLC